MSDWLDAPVVAHVVRNGFVESVHHAIAVVTAPDGTVEFAVGDPAAQIFPRSANKPIHAVAALCAGAGLDSRALALACASHSGSRRHLDGVRTALATSGLTERDLRNTPGLPQGEAEARNWLASGRGPERIAQCCSGNHAGMLAACVASGWDLESYLDPDHPFQLLARATTEELAVEATTAVAVDGCGTALFALPVAGLARAFGHIAATHSGPEGAVADAMRQHPDLVGGEGRTSTELMRAVPGLVAKSGAEGVFAAGLADGHGVAVKITDGGDRAAGPVLAALLARVFPAYTDAASKAARVKVLGGGAPVGEVVALPNLGGC